MNENYFVMDIETCPINLEKYNELSDEEKLKLLNPIDSKIIAIGIRYNAKDSIFLDEDEKKVLEEFWAEWKAIKRDIPFASVVGFNINNFDLPIITARSLINNVVICPFTLKSIVDLRDKINAYRYGPTRGKLKEYAKLMNLHTEDINGSEVSRLCTKKNYELLSKYLATDLKITDELYKRVRDTKILEINKW